MGRPSEIKTRVARNVIFENDELITFEEIVGKDHVSREIRAMIHNFIEKEKKGEAQIDPLNLPKILASSALAGVDNNKSFDLLKLSQREITDYIIDLKEKDDYSSIKHINEKALQIHGLAITAIKTKNKKLL